MHWPGIEPGSPAWEARILPLNHQCPTCYTFWRLSVKNLQSNCDTLGGETCFHRSFWKTEHRLTGTRGKGLPRRATIRQQRKVGTFKWKYQNIGVISSGHNSEKGSLCPYHTPLQKKHQKSSQIPCLWPYTFNWQPHTPTLEGLRKLSNVLS